MKLFEASDQLEWQAILKTKAVRVVHGAEAEALRKKYPERILSSRMVRRRKPLDERTSGKQSPDGVSTVIQTQTLQASRPTLRHLRPRAL